MEGRRVARAMVRATGRLGTSLPKWMIDTRGGSLREHFFVRDPAGTIHDRMLGTIPIETEQSSGLNIAASAVA